LAAVILMSKPQSQYADTSTSYEFPAQYLKWFAPLDSGEPIIAIVYEPNSQGRGRQAFVGWASITTPPERSPRTTSTGRPLWEVRYDDRVHEFAAPVRRDIAGEPLEAWLRDVPTEHRDIRTSGRSVRPLNDDDLAQILRLGLGDVQDSVVYPDRSEHAIGVLVAERTRRLVSTLERASGFREGVVQAYDFRCAVTQFSAGVIPLGRVTSLIEAAHIRPVADSGPDNVANGIAMTPTVHKLFDAGLFTLESARDGGLELRTSTALDRRMIESPDGTSRIELTDGVRLVLPSDPRAWPSPDQIRYHQRRVFQGAAAAP
jgi:putative restriction endonuclease